MELGRAIDAATIKKALIELNPEINTDPVSRLPSEWRPYFADPAHADRQLRAAEAEPIYFGLHYITSLDRGIVPEFTVFELEDGLEEAPISDFERLDECILTHIEVIASDPGYHQALLLAEMKADEFFIERGKVFKRQCLRPAKVAGRVLKQGWRATLEAVCRFGVPGITREALGAKLGVDLTQQPQGPAGEVLAALQGTFDA